MAQLMTKTILSGELGGGGGELSWCLVKSVKDNLTLYNGVSVQYDMSCAYLPLLICTSTKNVNQSDAALVQMTFQSLLKTK